MSWFNFGIVILVYGIADSNRLILYLWSHHFRNRPFSYSLYWTETSLQLRLMQGIFSNAMTFFQRPPLQARSSPIQSNTENTKMAYSESGETSLLMKEETREAG